ncbi:MAG: hypothetical protein JXM69_10475 [Anaerolineae bacterium]|nr:hypothetical protein [Anaerolineae bacterium]
MGNISEQKINKRDVEATVTFALNNIPQADEATLERFLELVNANGNFGPISHQQLAHKMNLLKKYVPETCEYSLLALAELLGIESSTIYQPYRY